MLDHLKHLLRYKDLLLNLSSKEIKTRYKGSVLGFFWSLLNPLALSAVYTFVFATLLKIQVEHFSLFLLTGLFPWLFFSGVVLNALPSVVSNGNLLKKVAFPTEILPISVTAANLFNFVLTLLVLFFFLAASGLELGPSIILLPVVVLDHTLFALGVAFIVSALFVYVRDIEHILSLLLTVWMYLTPILYPLETVPSEWHSYFLLNPMTAKIGLYRTLLYEGAWPDAMTMVSSAATSIVVVVIGYALFSRFKRNFPEEV